METGYSDAWVRLTPEEKRKKLYEEQKALLDTFLEHGAISRQQYEKSLGDLTGKMGYGDTKQKHPAKEIQNSNQGEGAL